ncbi:MAG TPA: Nramp family divalent metal transporter [Candidatus Sulfotelmatobacter sp.]|jgi:Mn2+/Fe2+ NRAMP family transporter|nr:Nramp family divalent metal transporter [Candidatus Sulfotelmatobacter sp.]
MTRFKQQVVRFLPIFAILGPGIISGSVDNDAGGIATYSLAGAQFGFSLLWVLFITTFALAITQEVGARMGLVTGKGLASLIREKFGIRWTTFIMAILFIANIGTIAAEFAGIAAAFEIVHVSKFISVPIALILVFLLITKGSFKRLEQIFLVLSAFYLVYIASAALAHPQWGDAVKSLVVPSFHFNKNYLLTLVAVIGTTITPWGQFFIQDYVVDKKLSKDDLKIERGDVFLGSFITNFISFFIIVACAATLFIHNISINDAKDAALALQPLAGPFAAILFGFGLLNASLFGAALVPVATSYVITEAFGFESGLNFSFKEAPEFYGIFTFAILSGAFFVIIPFLPLLSILFWSQALDAVLLLPILVFVYILSNDKRLLNGYKNGKVINAVIIITFLLIAISSIAYFLSQFIT